MLHQKTESTRTSDVGQIILLASLALNAFGWPIYQQYDAVEPFFEVMMAIVIASSLLVVMHNKIGLCVLLALGVTTVAADLASGDQSPLLESVATTGSLLFSIVLCGMLLGQLFSPGKVVDWRIIASSVAVYLLIGLAFADLYQLLGFAQATGDGLPNYLSNSPDDQELAAIYFSYVTLTTLGYGDLVPTTSPIASLAMLEAAVGQIFLAVVVARLVGLHVAREQ